MPTTDELTIAAHDYGMWVSKISDMKKQALEIQDQIDTLTGSKNILQEEIVKTKDAMLPLREELLTLERTIGDLKKKKDEVNQADRAAFDANQKILADQTQRLTVLADELDKRSFALTDRENAAQNAQHTADMKQRATNSSLEQTAAKEQELSLQETSLVARERSLESKNQEVIKQLTAATAKETIIAGAEARIREDRIINEQKSAKAASDLTEIKTRHDMLDATRDEINRLLPVLKEFYTYVKTHVKDPDGIDAMFKVLFPLPMNALNQGAL